MVSAAAASSFGGLSQPLKWLTRLGQRVNFGQIIFTVRAGQPDFSQPYRTVRTIKLAGGDNGARPESELDDFELRAEHIHLFQQISVLPDGARVSIDVNHGIPLLIKIEQDHHVA